MESKKIFLTRTQAFFKHLTSLGAFRNIKESIRKKLLFWFIILGLIPLVILAGFAYYNSKKALMEKAFENLQTLESNKANAIRKHFADHHKDMKALMESVKTLRSKAFKQLVSIQQLKKGLIENYFSERLKNVDILSRMPLMAETMAAFKKAAGSVGGSEWRNVERIYGAFLVNFTENYGYYDTFLVSPQGDILYTVAQESDMGQNLKTGELKDGPAGEAFQNGLKGLTFQDFGEHTPTGGVPAAFISAPIKEKDQITGVVMVQVSIDQINAIMQERTGMGETGETYLVGEDRLFRSDSLYEKESTVMNPAFVVDTKEVSEALTGISGQGVVIDYRGEYALSSWMPVNIRGVTWAMMAETDVTEAFVPKEEGKDKDFLRKYKERYGYHDLYMINPDGYLFYSVEKGPDFRSNILTGPYKDSNLGRLVADVLEKKTFGMADFKKYAPRKDEPAAFLAIPVIGDDGEAQVILAAQLSIEQINKVMLDRTGLGETGETYLVGADKMFRSNSSFLKDSVMNPAQKVDTDASKNALNGKKGLISFMTTGGRRC